VNRPELKKIVVSLPFRDDQFDDMRQRFPDLDIVRCELEDMARHMPGTQAAFTWRLRPDALETADALVWMQGGGAGVESLLTADFLARNILLTNASGVSAPNMAEHALAMMLAFARGIPRYVLAKEKHAWRDETLGSEAFELTGQTAVIAGTGQIGTELAKRLHGMGMHVIGARRRSNREYAPVYDDMVTFPDWQEALGRADHVISSLPHTPETAGMFNADLFAAFKPGSYFYNLGRGTTVVQDDLIHALESGHLAGAGLDVMTPEPLPADDPLWDVRNVLITSHQSGGSTKTIDRLYALCVDNIDRYRTGQDLRNVVDQQAGY
jgi:phosphoglycerate dehydrogenase-like enzyme